MNSSDWGSLIASLIVIIVVASRIWMPAPICEFFEMDRYRMDSPCFDYNFRCQVECGSYGLNFTGTISGCSCDCGPGWVSSCSGFYYSKNPENDTVTTTTSIPPEKDPNAVCQHWAESKEIGRYCDYWVIGK